MAKVIFVLQRRVDLTREQCLAQWSGEQHIAIVGKLPGLTRWVQNHVSSAPVDPVCDGIGELWFASDELMNAALSSPEMAAAVEDAKRFLDMERTGLILVEEKTLAGLYALTPHGQRLRVFRLRDAPLLPPDAASTSPTRRSTGPASPEAHTRGRYGRSRPS
jgi:uncharacterized protein (TIGR02118 family)